jgi:hypothetical protein
MPFADKLPVIMDITGFSAVLEVATAILRYLARMVAGRSVVI